MMTTIPEARNLYNFACATENTDATDFENECLSIPGAFLPGCAKLVIADRDAVSVEYYEWLISQLEG